MRYNIDTNKKERLWNAIIVYKNVLTNLVELKLTNFEDIDSLRKVLKDKMISELIMSLESKTEPNYP